MRLSIQTLDILLTNLAAFALDCELKSIIKPTSGV